MTFLWNRTQVTSIETIFWFDICQRSWWPSSIMHACKIWSHSETINFLDLSPVREPEIRDLNNQRLWDQGWTSGNDAHAILSRWSKLQRKWVIIIHLVKWFDFTYKLNSGCIYRSVILIVHMPEELMSIINNGCMQNLVAFWGHKFPYFNSCPLTSNSRSQ